MNVLIKFFRYFSLKEFTYLVIAIVAQKLNSLIPKSVITLNYVINKSINLNANIQRRKNHLLIELDNIKYFLRVNSSDLQVFDQIVLGGGLNRIIELLKELSIQNLYILDCGANIGITTLVLKKNFPKATIAAIEPETNNFSQLEKNIQENNLNQVSLHQMGVWYRASKLLPKLDFRDKKDWSFALKESESINEDGILVDNPYNIAKQLGWNKIDYLKVDIEGSEFPLLRNYKEWKSVLDSLKIISIEVHEEVGNVAEIEEILLKNNFRIEVFQELIIGIKNE